VLVSITAPERSRVLKELAAIRDGLHEELHEVFRGYVLAAYDSVLDKTPQWTGHAAAQWNIGVNHVDVSKSTLFLEENLRVSEVIRSATGDLYQLTPAKQVGDPAAIAEAKRRQGGKVDKITLEDVIFISNNVEAALKGSYASKLEENPNNYLRPENDNGHMVAKTLEAFHSRLAVVDEATRKRLRLVRLYDSGIMETL